MQIVFSQMCFIYIKINGQWIAWIITVKNGCHFSWGKHALFRKYSSFQKKCYWVNLKKRNVILYFKNFVQRYNICLYTYVYMFLSQTYYSVTATATSFHLHTLLTHAGKYAWDICIFFCPWDECFIFIVYSDLF